MEEEKKIVYQIFMDCWDMAKRYLFIPLDDFLWERWHDELEEKSQKYRQYDDATWHLYRDIATAIQVYKQRQDRKRGS